MELFEELTEMGHERVLVCSNPEVGLRAIIAVHSTVLGPGLGGVRMWPFESFEEAVIDALRLSRGMTYKAAAAGLNLGGGKAVIIGDSKKDKSEALFRSFGRYVESLNGLYITAEDVGTDMEDMELILTETRWVTGVSPAHGGSGDPSPVTAWGVLQGIKAALNWKFGSPEVHGRVIAIQGLGSVGSQMARYLSRDGAKVVAADIDSEAADRAQDDLGVEIVSTDEILEVECDVLAPCALGAILNAESIPKLRCGIVAGAANNQLANEHRDGQALHDREILYAPDFVVNAGGLINVYNELSGGYNRERALRMTRGIYLNLMRVFEISRTKQIPTYIAADHLAEERIDTIRRLGSRHWGRFINNRR
ncbi:MAG: Glu/Leu/Phe/Val dehydrogenase [Thermoanaerobaculia bacterium]|nr:Glu/Leu/Phe/Val dehydrogenase [Thermoanaerobaculia bacterium]